MFHSFCSKAPHFKAPLLLKLNLKQFFMIAQNIALAVIVLCCDPYSFKTAILDCSHDKNILSAPSTMLLLVCLYPVGKENTSLLLDQCLDKQTIVKL